MKDISLTEYIKSPCRASSIPYWKQKSLTIPDNMQIVHDRDFSSDEFADFVDEPYFRLYHNLVSIGQKSRSDVELIPATADKFHIFVKIINNSYTDLTVTKEQMESYCKTPVYDSDLWVLLKDKNTDSFVGCGIADYDRNIGELIIEWIQVLPQYRGHGYGQLIVNYLLAKKQDTAKFATVSGKVNNPANPERLYRKCGFQGDDIWHILYKKKLNDL